MKNLLTYVFALTMAYSAVNAAEADIAAALQTPTALAQTAKTMLAVCHSRYSNSQGCKPV